jgi:hypothetical protein
MSPATLFAISVAPVAIFAVWLLSPVGLALFAIRELKKSNDTGLRARWLPGVAVALLGVMWCSFVIFAVTGQIGGFGTYYLTTRLADWFLLSSLVALVLSIASKVARGKLVLASLLIFALWFGSEMVA